MGMKNIRLAGFHIALAAMLLRAFMPDGWMPAPPSPLADAGWTPFVICTSSGLVRLTEAPGTHHHDDDADHSHAPCPYAAAAHLAVPQGAVAVALYEAAFVSNRPAIGETALVDKAFPQRRKSRAPPYPTI